MINKFVAELIIMASTAWSPEKVECFKKHMNVIAEEVCLKEEEVVAWSDKFKYPEPDMPSRYNFEELSDRYTHFFIDITRCLNYQKATKQELNDLKQLMKLNLSMVYPLSGKHLKNQSTYEQ